MVVSSAPQPLTLPDATHATAVDATVRLLAAVERDRAELCESVHGGLVQSVLAARYLLDLLTPRSDAPGPVDAAGDVRVQMLREAVGAAVVEGRRLLARLRPAAAEHELPEALAALADTADGVDVAVTGVWPGSGGSRFPGGAATVLHRTVQAAVEHAAVGQGRTLRVLATAGTGEVCVEVRTDGRALPGQVLPADPLPSPALLPGQALPADALPSPGLLPGQALLADALLADALPAESAWGGAAGAWASCLTALGGEVEAGPGLLRVRCPLLPVADGDRR